MWISDILGGILGGVIITVWLGVTVYTYMDKEKQNPILEDEKVINYIWCEKYGYYEDKEKGCYSQESAEEAQIPQGYQEQKD